MLDSHCRESLTEGWARVWGRGEGRRPRVSTGRGRGQRGLGWVWGEGSQEGRGRFPRGSLFQEPPVSSVWAGRESPESGYEQFVPWVRGRRTSSPSGAHLALSQGNKKCPLVLGQFQSTGRGCQRGFSLDVQPHLNEVGAVFSCGTWHTAPTPAGSPLLPLPDTPSEGHGLAPGLATSVPPRAPGLTRATCPAVTALGQ